MTPGVTSTPSALNLFTGGMGGSSALEQQLISALTAQNQGGFGGGQGVWLIVILLLLCGRGGFGFGASPEAAAVAGNCQRETVLLQAINNINSAIKDSEAVTLRTMDTNTDRIVESNSAQTAGLINNLNNLRESVNSNLADLKLGQASFDTKLCSLENSQAVQTGVITSALSNVFEKTSAQLNCGFDRTNGNINTLNSNMKDGFCLTNANIESMGGDIKLGLLTMGCGIDKQFAATNQNINNQFCITNQNIKDLACAMTNQHRDLKCTIEKGDAAIIAHINLKQSEAESKAKDAIIEDYKCKELINASSKSRDVEITNINNTLNNLTAVLNRLLFNTGNGNGNGPNS